MFWKNKLTNFFQAVTKQRSVILEINEKVTKELTFKRTLELMKNKIKKAEPPFQVKENHRDMTIKCNMQLCTGLYIFVCAKRICIVYTQREKRKFIKQMWQKN